MTRVSRGIEAARRATVRIWDQSEKDGHRGQGLLLDLEDEGVVVLTCHHVIAPVSAEYLRVRIPQADGRLGHPVVARYDVDLSRPKEDAVVLRVDVVRSDERPLLHQLNLDKYNGKLDATVLTCLQPDNFNAEIRPSTWLDVRAEESNWPDSPDRYELRAFRLRTPDDSRPGISGGVVLCEEGVLGLVHFARAEGETFAREDFLVPLSTWSEGWTTLDELIEPLIDARLRVAAKVKRAGRLDVRTDLVMEGHADLHIARDVEVGARSKLEQHGGVLVVGKPKSGKTRLVWRLLQEQPEKLVVIPVIDQPPERFETSSLVGEDLIVLFDDLHYSAETARPLLWQGRLEDASGRRCQLICTSRDDDEWDRVRENQSNLLRRLGRETGVVYTSKVEGKGEDFTRAQGWQLSQALGLNQAEFDRRFDGTPGSLTLDFNYMSERYERLSYESHGEVVMTYLLDAAKLLHITRQPSLRDPLLREVAGNVLGNSPISDGIWSLLRRRTQKAAFGRFDSNGDFQIYRPYLEEAVDYEVPKNHVDKLLPILQREKDYTGLFYLGTTYLDLEATRIPSYSSSQLKDHERALVCFDEVLSLHHDLPQIWLNKGVALSGLKRHQDALRAVEEALKLDRSYLEAWNDMSWILGEMGRYEQALEASERAITLGSTLPQTWYNKGTALGGLGRHQEALEAFDRILEQRPDHRAAWYSRAAELAILGRLEEAEESFDRALSLEPDPQSRQEASVYFVMDEQLNAFVVPSKRARETAASDVAPRDEGWHEKAVALIDLGQYQEALEAINRALEDRPDNPEAWNNKGIVLSELGRLSEALEALDRALELRPDYAEAWSNKGATLGKLARYGDALEAINEALIYKSDSPESWHNKGRALINLGRHQEALEALDRVLEVRPDSKDAWYLKALALTNVERHEEALYAYERAGII